MELKNQSDVKQTLKLFVVGESSGNPTRWAILGHRALVAANTSEEAISLAGSLYCHGVVELEIDEPMVLFVEEDNGVAE